jgi:hypothetical protein
MYRKCADEIDLKKWRLIPFTKKAASHHSITSTYGIRMVARVEVNYSSLSDMTSPLTTLHPLALIDPVASGWWHPDNWLESVPGYYFLLAQRLAENQSQWHRTAKSLCP